MLNEHLADAIDLQLQAKQAHWNIKGPNFVGLHELFDRVAVAGPRVRRRDRRESGRARWSGTRNPPGSFRAVAASRISHRGRRLAGSRAGDAGCVGDVRTGRTQSDRRCNSLERRRHRRPVHRDLARRRQVLLDGRSTHAGRRRRMRNRSKSGRLHAASGDENRGSSGGVFNALT